MKTLTDLSKSPLENLDQQEVAYTMPISHLAHLALQASQFKNVANLAAIFKIVSKDLLAHSVHLGQNEKWVNRHPIFIVFSNRFAELAGISEPSARVLDAIEQCQEWADG